jgi:type IV secretion system protein VirB10
MSVPAPPNGDHPSRSPGLLPPSPKRGKGVRRLNEGPLYIVAGVGCVVCVAIGYTAYSRMQGMQAVHGDDRKPVAGNAAGVLAGAPSGEIKAATFRTPGPGTHPSAGPTAQQKPAPAAPPVDELAIEARKAAWKTYYAQLADLQKARMDAAKEAMKADTSLAGGGAAAGGSLQQQVAQAQAEAAQARAAAQGAAGGLGQTPVTPAGLVPGFGGYGVLPTYPPAGPDPSGPREKLAFTNQRGNLGQDDTLASTVRDPISPYLITAGDVIPCVAVTGENSDAPGQFVGHVSRNIYDSATGNFLLIPQGAKVIGTYDTVVTSGQARIPTVITRIIFPDSSSIPIGAMPAADQGGFAGLHDKVDRHLWEKFGNAVLLAAASAGIQISQGTGQTTNGYNAQQIGAAAIGQQFGQLGQEFARSGLSIPNTLTVRNGYPFVVQITKDMVLRPYVDRRAARAQPIMLGPVLQ